MPNLPDLDDLIVLRYDKIGTHWCNPPRWVLASRKTRVGAGFLTGSGVEYLPDRRRFCSQFIYASASVQDDRNRVALHRLDELPDEIHAAFVVWLHSRNRMEVT